MLEINQIYEGDCLEIMPGIDDGSIDLIVTDPPYYKAVNEPWDRQWDDPDIFLEWIGECCLQWHRILKPNGSLYVFASPKMAARVEVKIGKIFNVMNRCKNYLIKAPGIFYNMDMRTYEVNTSTYGANTKTSDVNTKI